MENYRSSLSVTVLLILLVFTGGCGINSYLDENRAWAEPKLAAIEDIYKVAFFLPSVTTGSQAKVEPYPVFKGRLGKEVQAWNSDIVFIEELKDIETLIPNGLEIQLDHSWFLEPSNLLRKGFLSRGRRAKKLEDLKVYFDHLKRIRYILVIKAAVVPPQKTSKKGFSLGSVLGTAILFDLQTSKHLGSFPIDINSSSFVTVGGLKAREDLVANLASDFENQIKGAMNQYFGSKQ